MRNTWISIGKNFLVLTLVTSILLYPVPGFAQSQTQSKKSIKFEKKVQVETKILIDDLEWEHRQIREDILDEFRKRKVDLGSEYLEAEKKDFDDFKKEEEKRLYQFGLDLERNSDEPDRIANRFLHRDIDRITSETLQLSQKKTALDAQLKAKIDTIENKKNNSHNYRLNANDKESLVSLLEKERDVAKRLLQLRNDLELIRNLAREGVYFDSFEEKQNYSQLKGFSVIASPAIALTPIFALLAISRYISTATSNSLAYPALIIGAGLGLLVAVVQGRAFIRTESTKRALADDPYKTKSLDSKIQQSFEEAIHSSPQEMTFDSIAEATVAHALLRGAGCPGHTHIQTEGAETTSGQKSRVRIDVSKKSRVRIEKSKVRLEEFSSERSHAAELEHAQSLEYESASKPKIKSKIMNLEE